MGNAVIVAAGTPTGGISVFNSGPAAIDLVIIDMNGYFAAPTDLAVIPAIGAGTLAVNTSGSRQHGQRRLRAGRTTPPGASIRLTAPARWPDNTIGNSNTATGAGALTATPGQSNTANGAGALQETPAGSTTRPSAPLRWPPTHCEQQHRLRLPGAAEQHGVQQQHGHRLPGATEQHGRSTTRPAASRRLQTNTTGTNNTASGFQALCSATGSTTRPTETARWRPTQRELQHRQRLHVTDRTTPPGPIIRPAAPARWAPTPPGATTSHRPERRQQRARIPTATAST